MRLIVDLCSPSSVCSLPKNVVREVLFGESTSVKRSLSRAINQSQKRVYRGRLGTNPEHATATQIREYLGEAWDDYFKFCFVRNPYDKAVSDYKWRTRGVEGVSFLEFLRRVNDPSREDPEAVVPEPRTNWDIYTIDGEVVMDFVGRYERLKEHLGLVCRKVELPFRSGRLPRMKASAGTGSDYRKYYNLETKDLVRAIYKKEIEYFGYEY